MNGMRKIGLLIAMLFANLVAVMNEMFQNVLMFADFKTEHRRVSDHLVAKTPFFDDEKPAGLVEKRLQIVQNNDVQIEEQGLPGEIVAELVSEDCQFVPTSFRQRLGKLHFGERSDFDGRIESVAVVGKANESVGRSEMAPDHRGESIDVSRRELRSPFHTEDVFR